LRDRVQMAGYRDSGQGFRESGKSPLPECPPIRRVRGPARARFVLLLTRGNKNLFPPHRTLLELQLARKAIDQDGRYGRVPNWQESHYGILFRSTENYIFLEILPDAYLRCYLLTNPNVARLKDSVAWGGTVGL
jgi:hypothetical protein